jgi:hypothetical protein
VNTLPATIALALIAVAALVSGSIVTSSGSDASALWAIAGTAAGAIGGAVMPSRPVNSSATSGIIPMA